MFFRILLSLIIGILSGIYSAWILLTFIPLSCLFFWKTKDRKAFYFCLSFLALGFVLSFFMPKGNGAKEEVIGIVTHTSDNYFLLLTLSGKYYVKNKGNDLAIFSIIKMTGSSSPLSFSHYESGFDFKDYLKSQCVFSQYQGTIKKIFSNPLTFQPWKDVIFSNTTKESRIILSALLFGDSLYELENYQQLYSVNLLSAFTLSGFHLSFLFRLLERYVPQRHRQKAQIASFVLISIFLLLSDFRFSMRRMFLLLLFRILFQQRKYKVSYLNRVSLVGIILLMLEPYQILSPSFYYSFPWYFYLGLTQKKEESSRKSHLNFFFQIQLFFLPIFLIRTHYFSFFSLPLQWLMFPFSNLLFLCSLTLLFLPQAAFMFNPLISFFLKISAAILPYDTQLICGEIPLVCIAIYYFLLFGIKIANNYNHHKLCVELSITLSIITTSLFISDFYNHYEIVFIDVDQGDSTLIRWKHMNFLIDTGGKTTVDMAEECLIPYFKKRKIKKLDAVFITHLDYDHYGALESLTEHFSVEHVFYRDDFLTLPQNTMNIEGFTIRNYNTYQIDKGDDNAISGVYGFTIEDTSVLIMGDAPKEVELKIIKDVPDLSADILKLGHHGSKTSSDEQFLKQVDPKLSIISCGEKNFYHHPSPETLQTLAKLNLNYLRTDQLGTISIDLKDGNLRY